MVEMAIIAIKILIGIVALKNIFNVNIWNKSFDELNCPDELRSVELSIRFVAFFIWLYICSKHELSEYIHLLEIDRHLTDLSYFI